LEVAKNSPFRSLYRLEYRKKGLKSILKEEISKHPDKQRNARRIFMAKRSAYFEFRDPQFEFRI